ncbi:hypothetical protein [Butyricimonas faecalis]|uniref:hypothetical protein n=1 Tax=Butyricimonas faecalis TaxID=2093856 RepID=UPI001F0CD2E2|nr:hypothetical protein [Butyricimonas faecalis]
MSSTAWRPNAPCAIPSWTEAWRECRTSPDTPFMAACCKRNTWMPIRKRHALSASSAMRNRQETLPSG